MHPKSQTLLGCISLYDWDLSEGGYQHNSGGNHHNCLHYADQSKTLL